MTDNTQNLTKGWSAVQVYLLAAICLIIGITTGYLFRGSSASHEAAPASQQSSSPAGTLPSNPTQPSQADMKRMADKQVEPLLEQLKSNPKDAKTLALVAHYYMVAGQTKDAVPYYERAVAAQPTPLALTNLANAYYYSGENDKAIESLNKALKLDPNSADALYNLGVLKWNVKGDAKGAVACWEQLIRANPKHPRLAQVQKMIAEAKKHEKLPSSSQAAPPSK